MSVLLRSLSLTAAVPFALAAQASAPPADTTATVATPVMAVRQSWTSDRRPLRPGDILTIVVDERANATEKTSDVARGNRSQRATLDANLAPEDFRDLGIGLNASSDHTGTSVHSGALLAVVSVRVTQVDPNGIATVEGTKLVTIDGRKQELRIAGMVRAEDVTQDNTVLSSRVANGEIFYKGKKISPRTGILGKLLGLLWP